MSISVQDFRNIEEKESLFDIRVGDVYIWERIRQTIFMQIKQQSGVGQPHTGNKKTIRDYVKGGSLSLKNILFRNPYLSQEAEFLFIGHPRRKKEGDNYWWDIYCDPLHRKCEYDYIHLEHSYTLEHKRPARTENIRYLDLIQYSDEIYEFLGVNLPSISGADLKRLEVIQKVINKQFNVNVDLISVVRSELIDRQAKLWLYKQLLKRINPDLVIVVVGYSKETLIEACQQKSVPVVEIQHGVIHDNHLGYAYPGSRTKKMFPDYLLVWGDFWKEAVEYPIPDERVISVGYPYLEQSVDKYNHVGTKNQLLFISQGTIGEQLSKFAMDVDRHPRIEHDIVYKLHPGEYDRWRDEYPWLLEADFEVVDSSDRQLYKLFAESSAQIGVGSTAVYEGLAFGLETYVYDCPGSSVLQPLVDSGSADLLSSVDDLASWLGSGGSSFDREYYFEPDATERACEVLERLQRESTL